MKMLQCIGKPNMNPVTGQLMRYAAGLVSEYRALLPRGWRYVIEICTNKNTTLTDLDYRLDLQDDEGGGSFAIPKIRNLRNFPELCMTGGETIEDLKNMIQELDRKAGTNYSQTGQFIELCSLPHPSAIKGELRAWLRDVCEISPYLGGIRVPYQMSTYSGTSCGEILITFSGALEWQDLFFTIAMFHGLQRALIETFPDQCYTYDLEQLKNLRETRLYLDLFEIKET